MADVSITPQQQQLIQAYLTKYPEARYFDVNRGPRGFLTSKAANAHAFDDWVALNQQLHATGLAADQWVLPSGEVQHKETLGEFLPKFAAAAGAVIGGAALAGAILGTGAAAAGTEIAAPFVPAGEAIAPTVDIGASAGLGAGAGAGVGTTAISDVGLDTAATTAPSVATGTAPTGSLASTPEWSTAGSGISDAPAAATTGGTTGGGGGFSGFVRQLGGWPTIIGAGVNLAGSAIQAHAASEAADQQAQAAREALGVQAQEYNTNTGLNVAQANQNTQGYNQTVSNLAPYRGIGASALSSLGYHLGLPGYQSGNSQVVNAPAPIVPIQPLAVPPPVTPPGSSTPGQAIPNQAFIPTTQQTGGLPQFSTGNSFNPGTQAPKVGDKRMINGQIGTWDGKGWAAS